jgi:2-aminoadipate transaminase
MRLSYCYPTPDRIREGVRRLVGVIEEEIELRETFGTALPEISRRGYEAPNTDLT